MPSLKDLLNTESLKSGGSYLSELADTIANLPTNLQRVITHPQIFNKIIGYNPMQRETGFAAAATGLPPKQEYAGGILNPPNLEYEKGYESGEPVAIAAGAAPFAIPIGRSAGKALAPKMYEMAEDYMVKTGGLIPITAWHGTPHNIQGKFDINKVGTGEGAQAYGHGMYFAENPNVAKEYQKMLAGPEQTAAEYLKMYKTPESAISVLESGIKPNLTAEAKRHSLDAINVLKSGKELKGNLYKVDIPDEHIPNMLDWDKPLSQQTPEVQAILKDRFPSAFDDPRQATGQALYKEQAKKMAILGERNPEKFMSDYLNEYGIKGIRYLDEGSRNTGKGTSNFVVFDPSEVQILEKNGQNVLKDMLVK